MNLFDKMHEGLVVVTKQNLEPKFSNKPAIALLKDAPDVDSSNAQSIKLLDTEDLEKSIFTPVKLTVENVE